MAKKHARAARSTLDAGVSVEEGGVGLEVEALYQYHNAWLHSLNAGASALLALGAVTSE
jgi:hypothetical protein